MKILVMPIRGKIINAFKAPKQKFFENEEVQAITQIMFGQEYKKGLTIEDCKVDRIIFMADADRQYHCPKMLFV